MKISKLFHWLYASVMMLPLVVAPVYAIFMHRHQVTNYQVTFGEQEIETYYYNQLVYNGGNFVNLDNITKSGSNSTLSFSDDEVLFAFHSTDYDSYELTFNFDVSNANDNDVFAYRFTSYITGTGLNVDNLDWDQKEVFIDGFDESVSIWSLGSTSTYFEGSFNYDYYDYNVGHINFALLPYAFDDNDDFVPMDFVLHVKNVQLFNLTDIYGSGNEPSLADFNVDFPNDYYDYGIDIFWKNVIVRDYDVVYSDSDIGSQFIYSIYLPLNKYFNVTNFLGLNNLYSWININVFNGIVPLGFDIFYLLLSYWLLVSIFWLVFDVVIYVPNLAHRWLDKGSLQ